MVTWYCALRRKDGLCALAHRFCVSRKGGTGGGGWGHPQGAVHMAAARLGCKRAMVGTEWANSRPGCMNRHRKCYSHLRGVWQGRLHAWTLSGYLPNENADYCMLINEWAWLRSRVCLFEAESALGFSFGVRAQTEIKCIKGMHLLNVVSSEKNEGLRG